ncbi:MAG TPA: hypothetical protein VMB72_06945 [Acidimicrobiales bacterium]|nr:hypothetical protein [Acidimicrobiales bacterium]
MPGPDVPEPQRPDEWRRDPFGAHQERLYRGGRPTALVRDDGIGRYDEPPSVSVVLAPPARRRPRGGRRAPVFVLVHSPLVGPTQWRWVGEHLRRWGFEVRIPSLAGFETAGPRYWEPCVQAVVLACAGAGGPLVLVGSGEAGPLLPAMVLALLGRVGAVAVVEASLPPERGYAETVSSALRRRMTAPRPAGAPAPPPWDERTEAALSRVPERRRLLVEELPAVPAAYFDQVVPVPAGWNEGVACAYRAFTDAHLADAREAQRRGWEVRRVAGHQLHMVVRPEAVARALYWTAVLTHDAGRR